MVAIAMCVAVGLVGAAHAYVDPGVGAILYQIFFVVVHSVLAALLLFSRYVRRMLAGTFRRLLRHRRNSEQRAK